jgi:hypothetical protein
MVTSKKKGLSHATQLIKLALDRGTLIARALRRHLHMKDSFEIKGHRRSSTLIAGVIAACTSHKRHPSSFCDVLAKSAPWSFSAGHHGWTQAGRDDTNR